ncbi:MAG: hypothetical protein QNJ38_01405 [Prochloraceae cyanobacterium]|nr:hypothetical protein [Prochloraceae cyanobacterium]
MSKDRQRESNGTFKITGEVLDKKLISVRISRDRMAKMVKLSNLTDRTLAAIAREAINQYIDNWEDYSKD